MTTTEVANTAERPPDGLMRRLSASAATHVGSRLFRKYGAPFVAVVSLSLLTNGLFEVWFSYQENKQTLTRIQREQAVAAAGKISQYVKDIEGQIGWTTQLPWTASALEQRRFDALRLLRQVPAITELAQLDASGKEQLRVSRLAMDAVGVGTDFSKDPKFTEAVAKKVYYGPVYFRRESEPYMTLSLAGTRKDAGVSIAEVNLKLIWDVVSQIKVGERGHAYVVGSGGRLIAHPDISLVLRNTDMSKLVQAQAAPAGNANDADALLGSVNIQGQEVLPASAPIAPVGWTMFVELPVKEAYASLYQALQRLAIVLAGASIFAGLAGVFLGRRMVGPIRALSAGAERIGGGDFAQRISIRTGDELEGLANQFNDMGARLQESYADLENKVEQRTAELSESLQFQTATSEVLKVISSSPDSLQPVLDGIVSTARELCGTDTSTIFLLSEGKFKIAAASGALPAYIAFLRSNPISPDQAGSSTARAAREKRTIHVPDISADPEFGQGPMAIGDRRALLSVPLIREDQAIGVITMRQSHLTPFTKRQIEVVETFADQAIIAISNVRLFEEVQERTRELSQSL